MLLQPWKVKVEQYGEYDNIDTLYHALLKILSLFYKGCLFKIKVVTTCKNVYEWIETLLYIE